MSSPTAPILLGAAQCPPGGPEQDSIYVQAARSAASDWLNDAEARECREKEGLAKIRQVG